jgi:hypothetical protein
MFAPRVQTFFTSSPPLKILDGKIRGKRRSSIGPNVGFRALPNALPINFFRSKLLICCSSHFLPSSKYSYGQLLLRSLVLHSGVELQHLLKLSRMASAAAASSSYLKQKQTHL